MLYHAQAKCESKSVSVAHDKAVETPSPQEDADCKIERVRYIWHGLSDEDRASLLNVPIQGLIHQAASNALAGKILTLHHQHAER